MWWSNPNPNLGPDRLAVTFSSSDALLPCASSSPHCNTHRLISSGLPADGLVVTHYSLFSSVISYCERKARAPTEHLALLINEAFCRSDSHDVARGHYMGRQALRHLFVT